MLHVCVISEDTFCFFFPFNLSILSFSYNIFSLPFGSYGTRLKISNEGTFVPDIHKLVYLDIVPIRLSV